jgi:dihydropteroate synthase
VHDVRETVDALKVWRAVECADGNRQRAQRGEGPHDG